MAYLFVSFTPPSNQPVETYTIYSYCVASRVHSNKSRCQLRAPSSQQTPNTTVPLGCCLWRFCCWCCSSLIHVGDFHLRLLLRFDKLAITNPDAWRRNILMTCMLSSVWHRRNVRYTWTICWNGGEIRIPVTMIVLEGRSVGGEYTIVL